MRIPRMTRIILVPEDDHGAHEYSLSRRMAIFLLAVGVLTVVAVAVLLAAFVSRQGTETRLHSLERELDQARLQTQTVQKLQQELEESRRLQEKLLYMLGVDESPPDQADSLGFDADTPPRTITQALDRAAAAALPPEPGLWPTSGRVTREFEQGNPVQGRRPHQGIDIAGKPDTPILAVAPGEVAREGKDEFLGNYVEIRHGLGYLTVYGHLSRAAVNAGEKVRGGQVIGYMGKSGQASATHLHFEIWRQGRPVDPRRYLSGEPAPQ